jgi:hypothetical protein
MASIHVEAQRYPPTEARRAAPIAGEPQMMVITRSVLTLTTAAVVLSGCTIQHRASEFSPRSTPAAAATPTDVSSAPPGEFGADQLRRGLLTVADMPAGWSATPDSDLKPIDYNSGCPALDVFNHRSTTMNQASFRSGAKGPVITEALVSTSPAEAHTILASIDQIVAACPTIAAKTTGPPVTLTLAKVALAPLGDESRGMLMSGPGFVFDEAIVRRDGLLLFVAVAAGVAPTATTLANIARTALDKADRELR